MSSSYWLKPSEEALSGECFFSMSISRLANSLLRAIHPWSGCFAAVGVAPLPGASCACASEAEVSNKTANHLPVTGIPHSNCVLGHLHGRMKKMQVIAGGCQ